jgi:hypothetical protein
VAVGEIGSGVVSLAGMEARSQRAPAVLAAASAGVLILSMFLDWYRLDLPERVGGREIDIPTFNAFEGLARTDVALLVAAVLVLVFAGLVLARVLANSPAPGLALMGAGLFALAVTLYRGFSRPGRLFFGDEVDMTLQFGWFVAVVAAALTAIGGVMAYLAGPRLEFEDDELDAGEEDVHPASERRERSEGA